MKLLRPEVGSGDPRFGPTGGVHLGPYEVVTENDDWDRDSRGRIHSPEMIEQIMLLRRLYHDGAYTHFWRRVRAFANKFAEVHNRGPNRQEWLQAYHHCVPLYPPSDENTPLDLYNQRVPKINADEWYSMNDQKWQTLLDAAPAREASERDQARWVANWIGCDPADVPTEGIPNKAAVHMLKWASGNAASRESFYRNIYTKIMPSKSDIDRMDAKDGGAVGVIDLISRIEAASAEAQGQRQDDEL